MTVVDLPVQSDGIAVHEPQRFIFDDADWTFYQQVGDKLADRRVFITYCKGKLEIVTVSFLHEKITALLVIMVRIMSEEMSLPLQGAGMTTLKRVDLDAGVEPDSSFYIANESRMRGKTELNLAIDPPPDLAIEVEVTRRLGSRKSIYRELGVPEVWVYSTNGLSVLLKQGDAYAPAQRSPTFPLISPQEMTEQVTSGLRQDQTAFTRAFRRRVQEALTQS